MTADGTTLAEDMAMPQGAAQGMHEGAPDGAAQGATASAGLTPTAARTAHAVFDADLRMLSATAHLAELAEVPAASVAPGFGLTALLAGIGAVTPELPASFVCRTPSGRYLRIVIESLPELGWSLLLADVTATRAIEAALKTAREGADAAARAKGRFLTTMSHELRTPLNVIIGFADAIAQEAVRETPRTDPAELREFALRIREAGQHLLGLIEDILDLARIEAGAFGLASDQIDIARLVQVCLDQARAAAPDSLTFSSSVETGRLRLRADERRLRQVLAQLLGNAMKFSGAGSHIDISARLAPEGELLLAVRDNGIGITAENQKRIFQPFIQLDNRLARRVSGAGIGLYFCRELARAHGGGLSLESCPGQGTTATLRLPAHRLIDPTRAHLPFKESP